ncbi:TPA: hypothetical protein LVL09_001081 [Klebsiella oxytoca]|nr:hypothetical protein [Citrobacter freundii]HBM2877339.1 hypothetical protein [Klebsiella oxytoca]HBU8667811.1 hypothetical protein [Klebsiella oxytoca]
MSQYDIPDLATPQADRMAPEGVTLRAQPRLVMRLNRRMLVSGDSITIYQSATTVVVVGIAKGCLPEKTLRWVRPLAIC